MSVCVLADTHVHFHRCFDRDAFFRAASENFRRTESELRCSIAARILCLTEKRNDEFFTGLDDSKTVHQLCVTAKLVKSSLTDGIHLIAGRQINSLEGLEILALNTDRKFNDGETLSDSIAAAKQAGATVVVNWCFGKWWGSRGEILKKLLREGSLNDCFVGDVPLRFFRGLDRELFTEILTTSGGVLSGSDPLPFRGDSDIAGSFGSFLMLGDPPAIDSVGGITSLLDQLARAQTGYGRRNSLTGFLRRQLSNEFYRER